MMPKIHKKQTVVDDVLTLANRRLDIVFDRFDRVAVFFSGGKDSTVCLQLALARAAYHGKLPLDVIFYDEEAIPPETVEYAARVAAIPGVRFWWYCLPVKHRNAASRTSPWWYPWAPEDRHKWCRELPPLAITDVPGFVRASIPENNANIIPADWGNVAGIIGIRTQESITRMRAIAIHEGPEAFISQASDCRWFTKVYPIYDWSTEDVWLAPLQFGWDYNRGYDVMAAAGIAPHNQRCAPPYGEQPLQGLWRFQQCWPELWAKMVYRVPGAATAARYSRTELYGFGGQFTKPENVSWRQYALAAIDRLPAEDKRNAANALRELMDDHRKLTREPIPEDTPHPITGMHWRDIAKLAIKGDAKRREIVNIQSRAGQKAPDKLHKVRAINEARKQTRKRKAAREKAGDQ